MLAALQNGTVWLLGIIFLLSATGFYGYSFWSPLVIRSLFQTTNLGVGLILAAISAVTITGMLLNSVHSDRTRERRMHVVLPLLLMGVGFLGCAALQQPALAVLLLALVPLGHCGAYGPFWSMPTQFLTGPAAASGIALVASIANVGGFLGPALIGVLKSRTESHTTAFILLGVFSILAALLALGLGTMTKQE
jgi:ACS family tartrate transporter-like MFS transporter